MYQRTANHKNLRNKKRCINGYINQ
jgi:hypothetical protein